MLSFSDRIPRLVSVSLILIGGIAAPSCGGGGGGGTSLTETGTTIRITTASPLPNGTVGSNYNAQLVATGNSTALTWTVGTGTSLPSGLVLGSTTGLISGTPGTAGVFTFTIVATDAQSNSGKQQFTLTIVSATGGTIVITTSSTLVKAVQGSAYNVQLAASGGTPPFTWSVSAGALPTGLTLSSGGIVSGTPTQNGTFTFTIRATDTLSAFGQQSFTLFVAPPIVISTASLPNGLVGSSYSVQLAATGGNPPLTFGLTPNSALPAGLSVNSTGLISGAPTATGTFVVSIRATDSTGAFSDHSFTFTIAQAVAITTTSIPNGSIGGAYSAQLVATGGNPPITWKVTSGALPTGLSLGASTGLISGTPTAGGSFTITVRATDAASAFAQQSFTFSVGGGPVVSTVFPFSGNASGGENVTITGTQFAAGATVQIGGASATVNSVSADGTQIKATTPANTASGWVSVQVTNATGLAGVLQQGFFYASAAGCGSECGNVGDPYEGQGPPPNQQPISSCNAKITSAGNFVLTKSIGTNATTTCLNWFFPPGSVNLDLAGFTITGGVTIQSNNAPNEVMNGVINCTGTGGTFDCIGMPSTGRIHHVTITSTAGAIPIDVLGFESATDPPLSLRIDHSTLTDLANPNANRTRVIRDDGSSGSDPTVRSISAEVDHNVITCSDNASACQGAEFFASSEDFVHNNNFILPLDCSLCSDSARATIFDATGESEFAFNTVTTRSNRGFRARSSSGFLPGDQPVSVHDNAFQDVTEFGRQAAVDVGENDTDINITPVAIFNNTFELGPGGNGVVSAAAINVFVFNNTVSCLNGDCSSVGFFAETDVPAGTYGASGTNMTVSNNNVAVLTAAGQPSVKVCQSPLPAGGNALFACSFSSTLSLTTSATVCNSGTVVGYGTINNVSPPCPVAPAASVPSTIGR